MIIIYLLEITDIEMSAKRVSVPPTRFLSWQEGEKHPPMSIRKQKEKEKKNKVEMKEYQKEYRKKKKEEKEIMEIEDSEERKCGKDRQKEASKKLKAKVNKKKK